MGFGILYAIFGAITAIATGVVLLRAIDAYGIDMGDYFMAALIGSLSGLIWPVTLFIGLIGLVLKLSNFLVDFIPEKIEDKKRKDMNSKREKLMAEKKAEDEARRMDDLSKHRDLLNKLAFDRQMYEPVDGEKWSRENYDLLEKSVQNTFKELSLKLDRDLWERSQIDTLVRNFLPVLY